MAEKTYGRISRLCAEGVVAEQKCDEARAQRDAAAAQERAAKARYDMAVNGTRAEDRAAAEAQAARAEGKVAEVQSYVDETVLTADADGIVTEIFPEESELVGTGPPIMNIAVADDAWFVFNVREDRLPGYSLGAECRVMVPALGCTVPVRITRIKDVGTFAVWRATKALDGLDFKTFEIQARPLQPLPGLQAGMSAELSK